MKIRFYLNFKEDSRISMTNYGNDHIKNLKNYPKEISISYFQPTIPKILNILPAKWKMRIARYLVYSLQIKNLPKVDIAHVVDQQYAHIIKNINAKKKIITVHDIYPIQYQKKYKKNPILFKYSIKYLKYFDKIISISNQSKKEILHYTKINKEKIKVLYQPAHQIFNQKKYDKNFILKFVKKRSSIKIITFSQTPYKNFNTSLKIFNKLNKKFSNLFLLNFGKVNFKINNIIRDRIIELPFMSRSKQNSLYRSANLLLFPSYYEGYGLPCVESIATNLPIVSSNIKPIREILGNAGLYCKPSNINCFVNKISKLIEDKKYYLKSKNKLNSIKHLFSQDEYYKNLIFLYKSVMKL